MSANDPIAIALRQPVRTGSPHLPRLRRRVHEQVPYATALRDVPGDLVAAQASGRRFALKPGLHGGAPLVSVSLRVFQGLE
jgi:hypothetical protein